MQVVSLIFVAKVPSQSCLCTFSVFDITTCSFILHKLYSLFSSVVYLQIHKWSTQSSRSTLLLMVY